MCWSFSLGRLFEVNAVSTLIWTNLINFIFPTDNHDAMSFPHTHTHTHTHNYIYIYIYIYICSVCVCVCVCVYVVCVCVWERVIHRKLSFSWEFFKQCSFWQFVLMFTKFLELNFISNLSWVFFLFAFHCHDLFIEFNKSFFFFWYSSNFFFPNLNNFDHFGISFYRFLTWGNSY